MDLINVGYISGFHGLKGEMKIKTTSDFIEERFSPGSKLILTNDKEKMDVTIKTSRMHKGVPLISLEGHGNLNDVEKFKGYALKVNSDDLYELENDEYYYFDLIGLSVLDHQGNLVGDVKKIMETPANEILVIEKNGKEVLIPFISAIVEEVDMDNKEIKLFEMEGLW